MAPPFPIALEPPSRLAAPHELALARLAHAAAPESVGARGRLALTLLADDRFEETVALFDRTAPANFADAANLTHALLSLETPTGNRRAAAMAGQALALADTAEREAAALAARGKAELRLGDPAGAESLRTALRRDPHNKDACKRLVTDLLAQDRPAAVLALSDALAAQGVGHSRLLAARTLAFARLGDVAQARASVAMADFLYQAQLAAPAGWPSLAAFNAALAAQLLAHPALRYERYGSASEQSWRVDEPLSRAAPLVEVALDQVRRTIAAHVATLAGEHPWLRAAPAAGTLHSWCVITESTGFETWHVHQFGWLSGVYYVQVPDAIRSSTDEGGCLAWGVPEDVVGAEAAAAYGRQLARPEPGMLLLFPSHAYHRTFAHGAAERRIVLAFDLWPH